MLQDEQSVRTDRLAKEPIPSDYARYLCTSREANEATVAGAIDDWEAMAWNDRAAIFLRAAELFSGKYHYKMLSDFFRFGIKYVEELYAQQPPKNSTGSWNRVKYRAPEVFVLAVSTFGFIAIGGGLPGGLSHPSFFTAFHFTGSTSVFKKLWKDIVIYLDEYKGYPRLNFHVIHELAEIRNAVSQCICGGFEYQGAHIMCMSDKIVLRCRGYVSSSLWSSGVNDLLLSEVVKIKVGPPSDFSSFMGAMIGRPAYDKITGFIQKAKDTGERFLVHVYDDADYKGTLELIDNTSPYALTGSIGTNDKAGSISIFCRFISVRSMKENFLGLEDFQYPSNLI
ncbi:Aldehyde/histidinol dehydrogenase [Suillus lakei]|nr:Aldehyde/histidinol dehydrogenase [Suillus lakei]